VLLRLLSADDIRAALPMSDAIQAMKDAFAAFSSGRAVVPLRPVIPVAPAGGTLLVKPAYVEGRGLGAKLVSFFPGNQTRGRATVNGIVVMIDPETGEPAAVCDGTFVTAWRTGAASGAATDLLARDDASLGAVLGCGVQGRTQTLAIDTVRSFERICVFDPDPDRLAAFVSEMQPQTRADIVAAATARDAVEDAHVICAATTSSTPVFDGHLLRPGVHLNGIGSFTPEMQEIDVTAVTASKVFVDSRESASAEAGDLVIAARLGLTRPEDWTEIGAVFAGSAPGRVSGAEITLFKSVGVAVQDIAACGLALERAPVQGLGKTIEL
jgi:ornithine cyclodeaminase/alanine dehydrogenase-like protein (mu-crystallin family)